MDMMKEGEDGWRCDSDGFGMGLTDYRLLRQVGG